MPGLCPVLRDGSVNLEVGEICDDGNRLTAMGKQTVRD